MLCQVNFEPSRASGRLEKWAKTYGQPCTGAALEISINGFTTSKESHFILNFKGSLAQALEIHGFTRGGSRNPLVHRNL